MYHVSNACSSLSASNSSATVACFKNDGILYFSTSFLDLTLDPYRRDKILIAPV
jgi:hypothetical protein